MTVQWFHLEHAASFAPRIDAGPDLAIVYGEDGGCTLDATGGVAAMWIPLRGSVQVECAGLTWWVAKGDALATPYSGGVTAVGRLGGRWLALLGGQLAWKRMLARPTLSYAQLLPNLYCADRDLRRRAIALARASTPQVREGAENALADKLSQMQAPLRRMIARCPGRTWASKCHVFLRLQRVRSYISAHCDRDLDIDALAEIANYAPCHFLHIFHVVYQTTPHAFVIERRLQRAQRLLRIGDLAVTEVAVASGFHDRSAFSRLFHQRFGVTAQMVRQSHALATALVSPRNHSGWNHGAVAHP